MSEAEADLRERLSRVGRRVFDEGLTRGASGNISARIPGTGACLIKPSGYSFAELEPEHFTVVDIETRRVLKGSEKPSIETPFHTRLYGLRPEVGGVVHVHPRYSIILSIVGKPLIPMGIELFEAPALAKGIAMSRFAPPGSEELADNLVESMKDRVAALMPHHGVTTVGKSIEEAAVTARVVEQLAQLQYEVMQVGEPKPFPKSLLDELVERAKKRGNLI